MLTKILSANLDVELRAIYDGLKQCYLYIQSSEVVMII